MDNLTFTEVALAVVYGNFLWQVINNFGERYVGPWLNKKADAYETRQYYKSLDNEARGGIDTLNRESKDA